MANDENKGNSEAVAGGSQTSLIAIIGLVLGAMALALAGSLSFSASASKDRVGELEKRIAQMEFEKSQIKQDIALIGIKNNSDLKSQIQGEIGKYVNSQKTANRKRQVKEFELAPEKAVGNVFGNPDAKIAMIEYSDFDCPFCLRFHNTAKSVVNKSQGNIKWIYKHMPLDGLHPQARRQAVASECVSQIAGNKTFWAFADKLMNTRNSGQQVVQIAEEFGVPAEKLSECMNGPEAKAVVESHMAEAKQFGVSGTPATIVMNTETGKAVMLSGAVKEDVVLKYVQKVL